MNDARNYKNVKHDTTRSPIFRTLNGFWCLRIHRTIPTQVRFVSWKDPKLVELYSGIRKMGGRGIERAKEGNSTWSLGRTMAETRLSSCIYAWKRGRSDGSGWTYCKSRSRGWIQIIWDNKSHRFNTVKLADQIMVMDNGDVKEFGTHDELMAITNGKYKKLYSLQAKGLRWRTKLCRRKLTELLLKSWRM